MPGITTGWLGQRLFAAISRGVLIAIGVLSIWWGITTFPVFWQGAHLDQMAESILDGEKFKPEILQTQLAIAASEERPWTRPEALRSATILQLSLAEQSAPENEKPPGPIIDQLDASVRPSLSATPADPLLWFVLFWATRMKDDRSNDNFGYLRMSYLVGPREGWVASRRNYIAFANFPDLPQDLAEAAITEFKDLVVSEYFDTAADLLPRWTCWVSIYRCRVSNGLSHVHGDEYMLIP